MNSQNSNSKLFVGGLNPNTTEMTLQQYFSRFGNVESTHIKRNENLRSKGYGVVSFEDPHGVEAVLSVRDHHLDGSRIDPKRFNFEAYTIGTLKQDSSCKLFVGGLSAITTDGDLRQYFETFGPVRTVLLKKDPVTGQCRGYGFLTFESAKGVEAILKRHQHVINGKTVDVKPFKGKPGKIFVGAINRECTAEEIRAYFEDFGAVTEFNLPLDQNNLGKNKGYCFITFESESSVRACLSKDAHPVIGGKAVDIKKAIPQEKSNGENVMPGFGFQGGAPNHLNGGPGYRGSGCPYCGGPGPVINPPRLWPAIPMNNQTTNGGSLLPISSRANLPFDKPGFFGAAPTGMTPYNNSPDMFGMQRLRPNVAAAPFRGGIMRVKPY